MSYTKGPWRVGRRAVAHNLLPILATDGSPPSEIAVVLPKPHYKDTQEANAQLIASAPELLEAARAALARFEEDKTEGYHIQHPVSLLRAAVAKAEGRETP